MTARPLSVARTGLVTSVGLSAPATCAAIRCGLTNPTATRFIDSAGEWIMSHSVPLESSMRGVSRLARLAAMAAAECLAEVPRDRWVRIPLLLCIAERTRPGRLAGLDDELLVEFAALLDNATFSEMSWVIPQGRVSVAVALMQARKLIYESNSVAVLIVATDTLLTWPTLRVLELQSRLLTKQNSNGLIPGEAASALLITRPGTEPNLTVAGLGFATEMASIEREEPLRAEGLSQAIMNALRDASCQMHDIDFRITDNSGEQYYFKEAALALSRTLRRRKEEFDIWHPAECIGEVGSAIGPAMLAVAEAAGRRAYAPGRAMLLHTANDAGQRAAIVTRYVAD